MIKGFSFVGCATEAFVKRIGGEGDGQGQIAGGDAFGQAKNVGDDLIVLAGKECAGAAKAHGHLVGDEQHVVFLGKLCNAAHKAGGLANHACGALHDGFDDDGSGLMGLAFELLAQRGEAVIGECAAKRGVFAGPCVGWGVARAADFG